MNLRGEDKPPFPEALVWALRRLGRSDRSSGEIIAGLLNKGVDAAVAGEVVAYLKERGFLNDTAYAERWLEVHINKGWGRYCLLAGLKEKGLGQEEVEALVGLHLTYEKEAERALVLARKRCQTEDRYPVQSWSSLSAFLRRRGFSEECLAKVYAQLRDEGLTTLDKTGKEE